MKQIAIIILNWNGVEILSRGLESMIKEFSPEDIYVVDNHSTDTSLAAARVVFPTCQYIELEKNFGFAGGYNQVFDRFMGQYEFLLLLNNDVVLETGIGKNLASMLRTLSEHTGMVTMKMLKYTSAEVDNFGLVLHSSGLGFNNKNEHVAPLCPSGGAAIYRTAMLQDVKDKTGEYFDSDFGFYAEDLDLGLRGRLLGWQNQLFTDSIVWHAHAQSMVKRGNRFGMFHLQRNQIWMVMKDYPVSWWWRYGWQVILVQIAEVLYHSMRGNYMTVIRAKWEGIRGMARMKKKRRWLLQTSPEIRKTIFTPTSLLKLWRAGGQ